MAWKIDRDYINEGNDSQVGRGQGLIEGETFTFRLRDDDDEVYYHGVADVSAAECDEENGGLYIALRWAEHDAGCTDLQVHVSDALKHGLTSRDFVNSRNLTDTDWVSIYG